MLFDMENHEANRQRSLEQGERGSVGALRLWPAVRARLEVPIDRFANQQTLLRRGIISGIEIAERVFPFQIDKPVSSDALIAGSERDVFLFRKPIGIVENGRIAHENLFVGFLSVSGSELRHGCLRCDRLSMTIVGRMLTTFKSGPG
jgi:hypothetical protein